MPSTDEICRRVVVYGAVQGVFFRDSTRRKAQAAGVSGWVRNRADGAVEAILQGEPDAVARLIDFCRHGPRHALVDRVEVSEASPETRRGFEIR